MNDIKMDVRLHSQGFWNSVSNLSHEQKVETGVNFFQIAIAVLSWPRIHALVSPTLRFEL